MRMVERTFTLFLLVLLSIHEGVVGFQPRSTEFPGVSRSTTFLGSAASANQQGYEPKWKKKKTLADEVGDVDFQAKGIKGTIPVSFRQGNATLTSLAFAGQPVRDVASQAGQFIKYGCGKGECGTCECMAEGKWIRPCVATVPASLQDGEEYILTLKEIKSAAKSSGKFFSVRSFIMGFYNNLLGMVGFVKSRRAASRNWSERREYEDLVKQKTLEKKMKKQK